MLASLHGQSLPPKPCKGDGGMTFCEQWEKRPTVAIIEGTPKAPQYAFSKRVIFMDLESNFIIYSDLYDRRGELWKVVIQNIRTDKKPNPAADAKKAAEAARKAAEAARKAEEDARAAEEAAQTAQVSQAANREQEVARAGGQSKPEIPAQDQTPDPASAIETPVTDAVLGAEDSTPEQQAAETPVEDVQPNETAGQPGAPEGDAAGAHSGQPAE
jgi:hypothetical protein